MRIAYLHYLCADDTAQNHVVQFARAAQDLGVELFVLAMNPMGDPDGVAGGAMSWDRVRGLLKRRLGRYLHDAKELLWNVGYVRRETGSVARLRPDVLLVRDQSLTASCVLVARRLRLPLVLELNSPADEAELYLDEYWHLPRVAGWLEGAKVHAADRVVVVSTALRDHLVERHGTAPGKFLVVPNGADVERFHPGVAPDRTVRCGDGPIVGFVGSFSRWHGTDLLAGMMRAVAHARPAVRFLMVGDGRERAAVADATAVLGDRVFWTGSVVHERVPQLVAAMDVAVIPDAGFYMSPLKALECMAAGRALVAPDTAPLREIVDDGVHGLLFQRRSETGFVAATLRLLDDAPLRRRLGSAAAARVRAELTWRHNAQRVLSACEAALAERGGRTACAAS